MQVINEINKLIKDKKHSGENIQVLKEQPDSDFDAINRTKQPKQKSALMIEGNSLDIKKVPINTTKSGFNYFLDGIERNRVLFNYNFIPVTYGYVSAVILKRTDKKLHSIGLEDSRENLYLPIKSSTQSPSHYFDMKDFADYKFRNNIINTGERDDKTGEYPKFPVEFEQRAHSDIQTTRGNLEKALTQKWLNQANDEGWLFIDGTLENRDSSVLSELNIVGVIKSHSVYYFDFLDQSKIYNMKKGERTSVFKPENKNVFTWYLKLHESQNGKEDFGIVRVEVPADDSLLNKVDEISSWILLETKPIAFPASRWDRMIYPIKYCEDYLKSKAPSWTIIESLT